MSEETVFIGFLADAKIRQASPFGQSETSVRDVGIGSAEYQLSLSDENNVRWNSSKR
jgi:hypothetical protein